MKKTMKIASRNANDSIYVGSRYVFMLYVASEKIMIFAIPLNSELIIAVLYLKFQNLIYSTTSQTVLVQTIFLNLSANKTSSSVTFCSTWTSVPPQCTSPTVVTTSVASPPLQSLSPLWCIVPQPHAFPKEPEPLPCHLLVSSWCLMSWKCSFRSSSNPTAKTDRSNSTSTDVDPTAKNHL